MTSSTPCKRTRAASLSLHSAGRGWLETTARQFNKKAKRSAMLLLMLCLGTPLAVAKSKPVVAPVEPVRNYAQHPEAQAFIAEMVQKHGFIAAELQQLFKQVYFVPTAARLMTPTGSTKPKVWRDYRARFIEPLRIQAGVKFWQEQAPWLSRAEQEFGVPASIIVAIIGVETIYGRNPGKFRVLDTLATLSFDYPSGPTIKSRASFFRQQLEEYLLLVSEANWDVFSLRGSYAGAIGIPQFMPSSYRRFGVDYDGDGKVDLRNSPADAIGSVGKFLREHGWQPGQTIYSGLAQAPTAAQLDTLARFAAKGIEPSLSPQEIAAQGLESAHLQPTLNYAVIDLPQGVETPDYGYGARNFYVITRYNRSSFYALSVVELANAIERSRTAGNPQNTTATAIK
ncbi:lytic murein transglycosylase B [Parvibium lacunae]|uniref:Lytic murein transglycosylase B n=1 Tax=Parvibium lacunae TaxID=1888893 RepID=A0A368L4K3_9BURK|nr:lytic murein transglycosylase B [Parvibium lacunae]RCS58497.1 lytic murein transglycosylase B [Parvibium lacunae]